MHPKLSPDWPHNESAEKKAFWEMLHSIKVLCQQVGTEHFKVGKTTTCFSTITACEHVWHCPVRLDYPYNTST